MSSARSVRHGRALRSVAALLCASIAAPATQAQIIDGSTVVIPRRPARQSASQSAFRRDREVAVLDRMLDEFSARGVTLGGLILYPGLAIDPVFISNVLANDANRKSDFGVIVRPEATLRTQSGRIEADLYAKGVITRLANHGTDNTEQVMGGLDASAEIGPLSEVAGGVSVANRIVPRYAQDSPVAAAKPLEYQQLAGNLSGRIESGRFRLSARGDASRLRFNDQRAIGGGTIFARDRDRTVLTGLGRAEYAVRANASVYVAASVNTINYRLAPPRVPLQRDSKGWGAYGGVSFDLTNLMRADLRAGYIRQNFDTPGVKPIKGLGLNGTLQYFPTRLTTVTLRGERSVQDTGVPGTAGYIRGGGEVQVDHELRRYFMATLVAGAFRNTYRGLIRRDRERFAAASATYISARRWSVKAGYQYNRRACIGCAVSGAQFTDHRVLGAMTFQL